VSGASEPNALDLTVFGLSGAVHLLVFIYVRGLFAPNQRSLPGNGFAYAKTLHADQTQQSCVKDVGQCGCEQGLGEHAVFFPPYFMPWLLSSLPMILGPCRFIGHAIFEATARFLPLAAISSTFRDCHLVSVLSSSLNKLAAPRLDFHHDAGRQVFPC
jgi:hypothetical protein